MTLLSKCRKCRSILAPWEVAAGGCRCEGPRTKSLAEVFYSVLCTAQDPLPRYDILRIAKADFDTFAGDMTATAVLAADKRFVWTGRGVYGLYRHGPLPGARNLEEVSRLVLAAVGTLHVDSLAFILKQLGYRFSLASLRNALSRSEYITWRGGWHHASSDIARRALRSDLRAVPGKEAAEFDEIIDRLRIVGNRAVARRKRIVSAPRTLSEISGIDWGGA
ncbi:MAG: hypothetical protein WD184_05300 [Acidimicrobiia bacterium]